MFYTYAVEASNRSVELSIASSQKDKQLVLLPDISVSLLFQMLAINIFSHHDYIF